MDLNLPLDIMKLDTKNIIQHSGIMDLREELEYLRSQMISEQIGCPVSGDTAKEKDEW